MATTLAIRKVRALATSPGRGGPQKRLIVVRVDTTEPGLHGLGCATFTQRHAAVCTVVDQFLAPLLEGRDPLRTEDLWQLVHVNAYWRSGPVMNNALSGVDMALWDIKGKVAGMPVYQLLGGKCREGAAIYRHADGRSPEEVADRVRAFMAEGLRHVRAQMGGYGGRLSPPLPPAGSQPGAYYDPEAYARATVRLFDHLRETLGDEVALLHDVHERLPPIRAVALARELERYGLFFLEDLLPPEQISWFRTLRSQCCTPLAMGELFVNSNEWQPLVEGRLIDFVRCHISAIGGITPARKLATLCEAFGIRTAWHGPGDVSPVGHAANVHLDVSSPNFGIQEWAGFSEIEQEMFPGCPQVRDGYVVPNDRPGLGIDMNEELAARYPCPDGVLDWTQARLPDGSCGYP
ncbi:MAG: starvation-sensing protein RspA [Lentisphaeria bacterium]|nr:starvation-sensing protein RspA [Lentisphaeria bacterium]